MERDPYLTLGVQPTADVDLIHAAYRHLVKLHHPDRGGDGKTFLEIQAAYELLSDPESRRQHDATIRERAETARDTRVEWEYVAPDGWDFGGAGEAQDRCYPESVPRVRPKNGPLRVAVSIKTMLRCWPAAILATGLAVYRHHRVRNAAEALFDTYDIEPPVSIVASQVAMSGAGAWVFAIGVVSIVYGLLRGPRQKRWLVEPTAVLAGGAAALWLINPLVATVVGLALVWSSKRRDGERVSV